MTKTVEMETSVGTMTIELDDEKAPLSTANFLEYVRKGHYDGTVFHRVINTVDNGFLDFSSESPQGWGYAVFGRVVKGTEVVDAIEKVRTGNRGGHQDVPLESVTIVRATEVA